MPTPESAVTPQIIGYAPGIYDDVTAPGPPWEEQMDGKGWARGGNPLGLPTYTVQYPGSKQGHADGLRDENPNPSAPLAMICMSAGSDSCLLYAFERLEKGYKTTHLALIGATFNSGARPGFAAWEEDMKDLLDDGTKILVVNDLSIFKNGPAPHETFKYSGYTIGEVPYDNYPGGVPTVLCHHTFKCPDLKIGANNSDALATSVYDWIRTGLWAWNPPLYPIP